MEGINLGGNMQMIAVQAILLLICIVLQGVGAATSTLVVHTRLEMFRDKGVQQHESKLTY